jgi:hypothetical protein
VPPTPLPAALAALNDRLAAILMALRPLIAQHFLRHPWVPVAITAPLWNRLGRYAGRFSRLLAAFAAGRVRAPRARPTPAPDRPAADKPAGRAPRLRLPRAHGWMLHALGHHAALHRAQLEALLAEPAMADLLAAAPAAGRILRPLCHMLGLPPPCDPPPRPPRAPRPRGLSPRRPWIAAPLHPLTRERPAPRAKLAAKPA